MSNPTKRSVLIVEDEPMMRSFLKRTLESDYEVITEENGKFALEWLYKGNLPDLLIVDLQMPEMDGFDFVEYIRRSGFFNRLPIIVLSSRDSVDDRLRCFELGANDYLIKPFNPKELKYRINNLMTITSPLN
ncbi:MAG: Sensor histidine kinase TodS [Cryomorphaceae bacterium]|nr:MAG: Sensor histidine kinase TodS [Cryomorphaceae bacterium]